MQNLGADQGYSAAQLGAAIVRELTGWILAQTTRRSDPAAAAAPDGMQDALQDLGQSILNSLHAN